MTHFTESTIEQAAIEWQETRKASRVNPRHTWPGSLGRRVTSLSRKPFGSKTEVRALASVRDSLLPKLMRGEVRVKDVEKIR
jgi:hypothetical protein